ncbi:MAG: hypothetical protein ACJA1A_002232 [Saprospiraceae bacterium]
MTLDHFLKRITLKQLIFVFVLSLLNFACKMFGAFGMGSFNGDACVLSNVEVEPLPTHCQLDKIGNFKLLIHQLLQSMQFQIYLLIGDDLLDRQM